MKKLLFPFLLALLSLFCFSCSLFLPWQEDIVIETKPAGAEIIIEGQKYLSPAKVRMRKSQTFSIYVNKDGYRGENAWCGRSLSATGILDLVGACAFYVPVVGFVSPAAWRHQQNYFFFQLTPVNKPYE